MKNIINKTIFFLCCTIILSIFSYPISVFAGEDYTKIVPEKYSELSNAIINTETFPFSNNEISKNSFKENYIPQGICLYKNYILISAYSNKTKNGSEEKLNSIINVYDKYSKENIVTLELPTTAHCGGIAYDGQYIWIAATKNLLSLNSSVIDTAIKNSPYSCYKVKNDSSVWYESKPLNNQDNEKDTSKNISYCTYFDNSLWVGSWCNNDNGNFIVKFFKKLFNNCLDEHGYLRKINTQDGKVISEEISIQTPKYIQGASFITENSSNYVILSGKRDYKKTNNNATHSIAKYSIDLNTATLTNCEKEIFTPPYIETTCIVEEKNLMYIIFESGANEYGKKNNTIVFDDVIAIDLTKIVLNSSSNSQNDISLQNEQHDTEIHNDGITKNGYTYIYGDYSSGDRTDIEIIDENGYANNWSHNWIRKFDSQGNSEVIIKDADGGLVVTDSYIYYTSNVYSKDGYKGHGGVDYVRTDLNGNNKEILYHSDYSPFGTGVGGPPSFLVTTDYLYVSKYDLIRINLDTKEETPIISDINEMTGSDWISIEFVYNNNYYFSLTDNQVGIPLDETLPDLCNGYFKYNEKDGLSYIYEEDQYFDENKTIIKKATDGKQIYEYNSDEYTTNVFSAIYNGRLSEDGITFNSEWFYDFNKNELIQKK